MKHFLAVSWITLWMYAVVLSGASASGEEGVKGEETDGSYDLNDPDEPWRESNSGVSRQVFGPFEPLRVEGRSIHCWGREYALGGMFPTAVQSQHQELFSGPVVLLVKQDGEWREIESEPPEFGDVQDDRVEFSVTGRDETFDVSSRGWLEYDGLLRTDLQIGARPAVTLEGLRLLFTFRPESAIFHHLEKRWETQVYERSPEQPGESLEYDWNPLVWVGNHDVGFTVVTETWDGWTSDQGAIRIERTPDSVHLLLEIITEPTSLAEDLSYHWGFMATPAKPMPEDRWDIRIGSLPSPTLGAVMYGGFAQPLFSFPQPSDFDATAEMLQSHHERGLRMCCYMTTSATSSASEVSERNRVDWLMSKVILQGDEWQTGQGLIGADACCSASSYADFMAWSVEQVMQHTEYDGVYIDLPGPYWCENQKHGCGRGGKRTFPFFATRDLHKRLYAIVKAHRPNGVLWEHTSETFNPLQLAWVDVYSDGEQFRDADQYPRQQVLEMFDRTYMEITGTGHQVGAVPAYLSSIGVRKDGDWSHWLVSRTLPYGQITCNYHGWIDGTPAIGACRARMEFGVGTEPVEFFRPHEVPDWFRVDSSDIVACLWQRKRDNAVLAVLSNWSGQPVTARLDGRQLRSRFDHFTLHDALTGAECPNAGEFAMFSVPADSFRLILLSPHSNSD